MIRLVQEKHPTETMQARRDFAHVTKEPVVELPYWFRDTDTGKEYYNLYAGLGWPQKANEKGDQLPGYAAIVAVVKGSKDAIDAPFQVVAELQEHSVDILITECVKMRNRWGFGVHPQLLDIFIGNHTQFENVVASYNTVLAEAGRPDHEAFIVSPADDFDSPQAFDLALRRLQLTIAGKTKRLYLGDNVVIKNRILSFKRDDPAILALGGLVHTLLLRVPWMEQSNPSVFQLDEV